MNSSLSRRSLLVSLAGAAAGAMLPHATLAATPVESGENWPDFRGPAGDGISHSTGLPLEWSETKNVRWKVAVPGKAWSSPVVWGGQVWLTTATEDGKRQSVLCYDRATGKVLLDRLLFENTNVEARVGGHEANTYASPSPVIEAGRVYVHFGKYGTACLDTRTFQTVWQRRDLLCNHMVGPGSSPVLFRDTLILTYDGTDFQFITALNKRTGATVWKTDRSVDWNVVDPPGKGGPPGDQRKAFSTPLITTWEGKPIMISTGAKASYAYDPLTGKELWRVDYTGFSNAARPLAGGGLAYVNTGYGRADMIAVRLGGSGDVSNSHVAWKISKNVPLNPSPILLDGLIYMVNSGGIISCLDAKTGEEIWKERLTAPFSASPVLADGRIYLFNEGGDGFVVGVGRSFKKLAENRLEDGLMGSPAVAGHALYLRTKTHLYRIEAPSA